MRPLALAPLLLMACSVLDQTYAGLDDPPASSTDGENSDDTTNLPEPTTGTTTGHHSQDMGAEPETTGEAATVEIVAFEASSGQMLSAGSVVLTAEVVGEHTELSLLVHRNGEFVAQQDWPLGESSLEYKVTSDALDGELQFTLEAMTGAVVGDSEQLSVEVDLPASGTKVFRWVSPAISQGMALAVVPSTGTARDKIVVVGNDLDDVLLMGMMDTHGAVPMTALPRMKVHAIDATEGFVYVAGELDGNMVIRKYTDKLQQYWEFERPNARALDVTTGPNGDVYVAGEADVDGMFPHMQAALWVLTESASPLVSAQFAWFDVWDFPRASSLAAVGHVDGRVIAVGYREHHDGLQLPRATLFELADGELIDRQVYEGSFVNEECKWSDMFTTAAGVVAVGWHRADDFDPQSVAFGSYNAELQDEIFSPAWGGFGVAHAVVEQANGTPVLAGERTIDSTTRFLLQSENWEYIDEDPAKSWAKSVVVDRHGYIYGLGSLVDNGMPHLVITVLNP